MKSRFVKWLVLLLSLGIFAALMFAPLPSRWKGIWQSKLFDLGHVPLFAGLTWAAWLFLGPRKRGRESFAGTARRVLCTKDSRPLFLAVSLVLGVAGLAEICQELVGRTASLDDFLRGALGSLAAAAGILAWRARSASRPLAAERNSFRSRPDERNEFRSTKAATAGFLLVMLGLLAWPVLDATPYLVDAYEGYLAFPTLADFRTSRELLRWRCRQAELTRCTDPQRPGDWRGRLKFFPGPHQYSYGALRPIRRDFSAHRWLCCSFSVKDEPLALWVSIRSGPGEREETNHVQQRQVFAAGDHCLRLDLWALAPKAHPRPLDLSDVWIVQFFLINPQKSQKLYLHRIWLEE